MPKRETSLAPVMENIAKSLGTKRGSLRIDRDGSVHMGGQKIGEIMELSADLRWAFTSQDKPMRELSFRILMIEER